MPRRSLRPSTERFVREYLRNGYCATRAYKAAHPRCGLRTAAVNGSRSLRKADVVAVIAAHFQQATMSGAEALARLSNLARGDIRGLFDAGNRLLPIHEWPEHAADCVKSIKPGPHGTTIVLHDKLRARELMAVAAGLLRQAIDHTHTGFKHELYLGAEPPAGTE